MQITLFTKLFLIFVLYLISDLSIKKHILKKAVRRANKAKILKNLNKFTPIILANYQIYLNITK